MSTNTGLAPEFTIAETVGIAVFDAVITSSPFLIPKDKSEISKASVPLPTATAYLHLYFFEIIFKFRDYHQKKFGLS